MLLLSALSPFLRVNIRCDFGSENIFFSISLRKRERSKYFEPCPFLIRYIFVIEKSDLRESGNLASGKQQKCPIAEKDEKKDSFHFLIENGFCCLK